MLDDPVKTIVGDRTAKVLASGLGIETVGDLLRHYPRRYARRGELTDLARLEIGEHVTVMASVKSVAVLPMRQRKGTRLLVEVTDGRGVLTLTFFNAAWRQRDLREGRHGLFSGKVGLFNGKRQLAHPEYILMGSASGDDAATGPGESADGSAAEAAEAAAAFARALIPVYPATAELVSWKLAKAVAVALDSLDSLDSLDNMDALDDPLPAELRTRLDLPGLAEALALIHRPETTADVERARRRLVFEEAFVLQAELMRRRALAAALPAVPRLARPDGVLAAFDERLPFTLTDGQVDVAGVLADDLARPHPMQRLLQGEVGSGKTVVALRAMLTVVDAGGQAALLAPTEVLAQQHHRSISALLGPLAERGMLGGSEAGTKLALLTGSLGVPARRQALLDAASGEAGIVIGTHALLEERVSFFDLGLVVVDEQHRFGVEQRAALTGKGATPPHVLVMTATPIPRTVAMTVFGDLEVSTLRELPRGRSPITSHVVPAGDKPHFLERAWARVREEVDAGHQAFVVAPRIGADDDGTDGPADGTEVVPDADDRRPPLAVLDVAPALAAGALAGLRLAVLHGRMPAEAKEDVMRRFVAGEVDVLVSTTVVEVGVDVPNATVMVVLDADRFGVSQLHQLRGRIGRGTAPGLCLLVTELPASPPRDRLEAVAATVDGFELSMLDLRTRREGDVLGASQSGARSSLRLLNVLDDEDVIVEARAEAAAVIAADPALTGQPALRAALSAYLDPAKADYLEKS